MKNVPLKERLAVIVIIVMLITNPLTGQYVNTVMDWTFAQLFMYGAYISIAGTVYLLGLGVYYYRKISKLNIPAKTAKTKAQKYLAV